MPTGPVDTHGTELYYEDTGPLESGTYTTIVIVHGTGAHGGTYYSIVRER